jgi:L-ascorbate metabolism protein UlaG (beta-lactamase superfamily)
MKKLVNIFKILLLIIVFIFIGGYFFMMQPQFGKNPSDDRLEKIKKSPNYKNGKFQNLVEISDMGGESNFNLYGMLKEFYINKSKRREPKEGLPSVKTDLKNLKLEEDILIWLGHSSYFLQLDGKRFLIDPVLSTYASPVKFYNKSYEGSNVYLPEDFPDIDYLLISHDHYDHLDYESIIKLKPKIKTIITGLGTGAHFEYWGYDLKTIIEKDWNESIDLGEGFEVTLTPAKHRSGRSVKSNQTLWTSFIIKTPTSRVFYSGDSGYGNHFKTIGGTYGPFDLAIMECGQYSKYWPQSHMMPEQVVKASNDLKAEKLITGHWAKFTLSIHDWDEPINRVFEESQRKGLPLLYPMIGEKVNIKETVTTNQWWRKIK